MANKKEEPIIEKIYTFSLEELMGDRFGKYSKEIIQERALPDVRDGLKPVQRRILYSMSESHYTYDKPYRKSAKTVGEVMGNFHPHGDSSIYEAIVRMSQNWKMRECLVDIHGNNGSIDGDGPAASRYTEARLTKIANVLLDDIHKDTVEMTYNFDDTVLEPTVLPARFPNLLVNGSTGISAGYATNIPPHNLGEIIDATIKRIDSPNCSLDTIIDLVKGPDFPTGGIIEGKANLRKAYESGKGKIVVKARTEIIKEGKSKKIIIHEIPYDVNKENLREKIEHIRIDKKIDGIVEVIDESDKNNLARLVIDLKKDADAELILNYLLKNTDLQINYNFNMVAIVNRRPKLVGILDILDAFINHQKDVITRRTRFDLEHAKTRYHILEGLIKAISILDEVIKTIRSSKNKADAIANLVKAFEFTEIQAKAIVELQLYRLTNTDITAVEEEMANLQKNINIWNQILINESALKHVMKTELKLIKKEYANPRRTDIKDEITEIKLDMKSMISKEQVMVVVTNEGYIKKVSMKSYQSANGEETLLKPGDYVIGIYNISTLDTILVFTNYGNYLYLPVYKIPDAKWKELGKHINNIVAVNPEEKVVASIVVKDKMTNVVLFTQNGMTKRTTLKDYEVNRFSKSLTAIKLKNDDKLINVCVEKNKTIFVTQNGYYLYLNTNEIPVVGAKASGVKGINLKEDIVINGLSFDQEEYIDIFTDHNTAKRIKVSELELSSRAKKGSKLIKKSKTVIYNIKNAFASDIKDIICLKNNDEIKELKNSEIPIMDLASTGSTISKNTIEQAFKKATVEELKEVLKKEEPTDEQIQLNLD